MKNRIVCMLLALVMVILAGCGGMEASNIPQDGGALREFTDSAGRTVEVPENITRVAVTGQLAQIVVFSVAPDKLVAIASEWSEDAEQYIDEKYFTLPVLGQLFGGNSDMNVEELLKAAPQVIIDVGESKESIAEDMDLLQEQSGIPAVHINAELYNMDEAYRMLGELLHVEEAAQELADYCTNTLQRTYDIMDQVGEENKVSALYCLGDMGCNVICRDSYHSSVLDLLTDNLAVSDAPSSKGTGNEVDMEQIYNWDPEVIFFAPYSIYGIVEEEAEWANLQAIESGRYYEVPYCIYNWMGFPPSVQRYLGMVWMTKVLYPEYADYDMYEEVQEFYRLFLHCEVTQEQYDALVQNSIGKMEGGQ